MGFLMATLLPGNATVAKEPVRWEVPAGPLAIAVLDEFFSSLDRQQATPALLIFGPDTLDATVRGMEGGAIHLKWGSQVAKIDWQADGANISFALKVNAAGLSHMKEQLRLLETRSVGLQLLIAMLACAGDRGGHMSTSFKVSGLDYLEDLALLENFLSADGSDPFFELSPPPSRSKHLAFTSRSRDLPHRSMAFL